MKEGKVKKKHGETEASQVARTHHDTGGDDDDVWFGIHLLIMHPMDAPLWLRCGSR